MVEMIIEQSDIAEVGMTAFADVFKLVGLVGGSYLDYERLDEVAQEQVRTGMSHISLDISAGFLALSSSFSASSKMINRICSIAGRMMVLMADWIPDHSISPHQLVIQLFFLLASFRSHDLDED